MFRYNRITEPSISGLTLNWRLKISADKRFPYCGKRGGYRLLCWFCGWACANRFWILSKWKSSLIFWFLWYLLSFEGSSFMFGRFLTSVLWGLIADHYGRKPVIMFGTIAVLALMTFVTFLCNFLSASLHLLKTFINLSSFSLYNRYVRVIFNTLFGVSTNFWMAISTRFLLGVLCGILGPVRVCLLFWCI